MIAENQNETSLGREWWVFVLDVCRLKNRKESMSISEFLTIFPTKGLPAFTPGFGSTVFGGTQHTFWGEIPENLRCDPLLWPSCSPLLAVDSPCWPLRMNLRASPPPHFSSERTWHYY